MKSTQSEGKDNAVRLREQIMQLQVAIQGHSNPQPVTLDSQVVKGMVMKINIIPGIKAKNQNNAKQQDHKGIKLFQCEGWGHSVCEYPGTPLNGNWGEVAGPSNLPQRCATKSRGARDVSKYQQTGGRI